MHINKRFIYFKTIFIAFIAAIMYSCEGDEGAVRQGAGTIIPQFGFNTDFTVYGTGSTFDFDIDPYLSDAIVTLSTIDGAYSNSWTGIDRFPKNETFLPADYILTLSIGNPQSEGIDSPYFFGSTTFRLEDGSTLSPEIISSPESFILRADFDSSLSEFFDSYSLIIHSCGSTYIEYPQGNQTTFFVKPGDAQLMMRLSDNDGKEAIIPIAEIREAKGGTLYQVAISTTGTASPYPAIVTSYNPVSQDDDTRVEITPDLFTAYSPPTTSGFISGEPYHITEGAVPVNPLLIKGSMAGITELNLSADWLDIQQNLIEGLGSFASLGVDFTMDSSFTIDLTDFIPNLRQEYPSQTFTLSLQSVYDNGTVSDPVTLIVVLNSVDMQIAEVAPVITGINLADITFTAPEFTPGNLGIEILDSYGKWQEIEKLQISDNGNDSYTVSFDVPETESNIFVRIIYCGEIKETLEIQRTWPRFSIAVDAFATKANILITPEIPELIEYIIQHIKVFAGDERLTILSSDSQRSTVLVSGLRPSTFYNITATVRLDPAQGDFSAPVAITTERNIDIGNGDFEETRQTIKYENLPSGGRYSQTIAAIFNQQNYTTYNVRTPLGWANVNDKTFCTSSTNKNTWYMQPSVIADREDAIIEATAIKIINTSWDNTGEQIPDYLQTGQPYTKYSLSIPQIKYKAVGKLFLGSYSFNPATLEENYNEGISFPSRPSSLNGYYKFIPVSASDDQFGYAVVQILGKIDNDEVVIAENEIFLSPVTGFTAFNVPLSYNLFGVKATKVKILFAASPLIGSIEYETQNVVTVPDPVTATDTGNILWIDGVNFSY